MKDEFSVLGVGAAQHLLMNAGDAKLNDKILLIFDSTTQDLVDYFQRAAELLGLKLSLSQNEVGERHGLEPDKTVVDMMLKSTLIIALTKYSLAHSKARQMNAKLGGRFLSLPQYTKYLFLNPMILQDYRELNTISTKIANLLTAGSTLNLQSDAGTFLTCSIAGRIGNACPGFVLNAGDLGSPPDSETNIAPVENSSNGLLVVDGSVTMPGIGLLDSKVILEIKNGMVIKIKADTEIYGILESELESINSKRRVVAEIGIGLNPLAQLTGNMLSDEGTLGTCHIGLGANSTIGGKNIVDFHLDFVFRNVSVFVDDILIWDRNRLVK
jgi:leucyl aminopeptidase (aminopeptidase T)